MSKFKNNVRAAYILKISVNKELNYIVKKCHLVSEIGDSQIDGYFEKTVYTDT